MTEHIIILWVIKVKEDSIFGNLLCRKNLLIIKYSFFTLVVFIVAFSLLRFPETAGKGVSDGLNICFKSIIPSLYPFMIVSSLFLKSGICEKLGKPFSKVTYFLFKQPPIASTVILMSNIGGFPIGASMTRELYNEGKITKEQGRRLLMFCINPGPAFVISYIGSSLLSCAEAGLMIYISIVLSSLLTGFLTRFIAEDNNTPLLKSTESSDTQSLVFCFVEAVKESTASILAVCSWVTVFSCINQLIDILNLSENTKMFICSVLEVTNGCNTCAKRLPLALIAGIVAWNGLCVHFQIMPSVIAMKLSLKHFFTSRIINAALAVMICKTLFEIYPIELPAFANAGKTAELSSSGLPVSFGMLIMCILLLIGDNFVVKKRKSEQR